MASKRTPASVSNHRVAPPFPQGAGRCSASAPLGVGSRRAAAIPGGECTHPQFVHGRGHAPAFGRFAHVSPSPLVARQSEFCGSRPSLSLGRCAMCGVRDCISVRSSVRSLSTQAYVCRYRAVHHLLLAAPHRRHLLQASFFPHFKLSRASSLSLSLFRSHSFSLLFSRSFSLVSSRLMWIVRVNTDQYSSLRVT